MEMETYIERIEQYEGGTMTPAERRAFESELATNETLREAHRLYLLSGDVVEQGIENNLRDQLRSWEAEEAVRQKRSAKIVFLSGNWAKLAAAASVALLLGWFGWQYAGSTFSDESLYAARYELPSTPNIRAGGGTGDPLGPGFEAINRKDWQAAIEFFNTIGPDNAQYAEARYFQGHAYVQSNQNELAIAAFGQVIASGDPRYKEKAEWNLLLAKLAAGQTEDPAFREMLGTLVSDNSHSYHQQAVDLQQKLNSFWRNVTR